MLALPGFYGSHAVRTSQSSAELVVGEKVVRGISDTCRVQGANKASSTRNTSIPIAHISCSRSWMDSITKGDTSATTGSLRTTFEAGHSSSKGAHIFLMPLGQLPSNPILHDFF